MLSALAADAARACWVPARLTGPPRGEAEEAPVQIDAASRFLFLAWRQICPTVLIRAFGWISFWEMTTVDGRNLSTMERT